MCAIGVYKFAQFIVCAMRLFSLWLHRYDAISVYGHKGLPETIGSFAHNLDGVRSRGQLLGAARPGPARAPWTLNPRPS